MPNKRDPNKVMIGVYVDREVRDLIKEILSDKGVTITDFVYAQLLRLLNNEEDEIIKKLEERDGRTIASKIKKHQKSKKID